MKNEKLFCVRCMDKCQCTVTEVIERRLNQHWDGGGAMEDLEKNADTIASFLGNLSQKLVEKGILTQEELEELL